MTDLLSHRSATEMRATVVTALRESFSRAQPPSIARPMVLLLRVSGPFVSHRNEMGVIPCQKAPSQERVQSCKVRQRERAHDDDGFWLHEAGPGATMRGGGEREVRLSRFFFVFLPDVRHER